MTAVLRPIASTMRFAHLSELSLAPCAARRLWARTRSSSIPLHLHGSRRRLQCRTRLDERFSDLFLLLRDVELGRNGDRLKSKYDRSRKAKQVVQELDQRWAWLTEQLPQRRGAGHAGGRQRITITGALDARARARQRARCMAIPPPSTRSRGPQASTATRCWRAAERTGA